MTHPRSLALLRLSCLGAALGAVGILSGCVVQAPPPRYYAPPPPPPATVYQQPAPVQEEAVVSVYVEPPLVQPEPIAVAWAPPPMLVEVPPPQPYPEAIWIGGYWAWEGRWFWSAGRWAPPPRPDYGWVQPYYEHRGDVVVFVPGFWCAPHVRFVPPPVGINITVAIAAPGVRFGPPPMGPQGVFVPPPPGSRAGIIVPAPIGTPPAVVVSAPAVVNVGMRVHGNVTINNYTTTNVTNITNVTIEAPAGATANGQAFRNDVPARAHLAAAMAPAGHPAAPRPVSAQAIPSYQSGRPPMALPTAQTIRTAPAPAATNYGARPTPAQPALNPAEARPGQSQPWQAQPQQPARPPEGPQNREEFEARQRPLPPGNGQAQPANAQDPRVHPHEGNAQAEPANQAVPKPAAQPPGVRPEREKDEKKKSEREKKEDERER